MNNDILLSVKDKIATITINLPEQSNAIASTMVNPLREAVEQCGKDPAVNVIIITGAGKNFSAGGSIAEFKGKAESGEGLEAPLVAQYGRMSAAIRKCPKPVIAMVNGAAAGAGCSLALACDFRIATEKSRFIMAFISMALPGDTGGFYYLERLVGLARATEIMMTGAPVDGKTALAIGLANRLAEEGQLEEVTYKFAARLAALPGLAIARQKAIINEFFFDEQEKYTAREGQYMEECSKTNDFKEAVSAFFAKRPPVFKGE
ncbi:enoyl-CoA hydratase/isomerase family protein [Papillibacter cinnamivorans]|uniref:2-(1,2-epoxy-1,2-dihydrophenyl)acetyl-CoA isomerase n=1 Tax=Papillibacter cinnamivorans DSM 12816 TaxID=1122930 RepID=A0A1W2BIJ9_9FIRM|nr:enoyl-CoA hydratase-related protein [Papillibacter cinnamivorans]SMC72754.1 2-(1,2-epoxy-1,2-dihydrophenyl)acetyl-CoA isomerase [Papillibacter cinnamivorans DSM 12816]